MCQEVYFHKSTFRFLIHFAFIFMCIVVTHRHLQRYFSLEFIEEGLIAYINCQKREKSEISDLMKIW